MELSRPYSTFFLHINSKLIMYIKNFLYYNNYIYIKHHSYFTIFLIILLLIPNVLSFEIKTNLDFMTSGGYEKGYRYNIQGWVYIHIEGEPYERGYQYGYLASNEIIDMIKRWSNLGHDIKFMKLFLIKNLPKNYDKLSEE